MPHLHVYARTGPLLVLVRFIQCWRNCRQNLKAKRSQTSLSVQVSRLFAVLSKTSIIHSSVWTRAWLAEQRNLRNCANTHLKHACFRENSPGPYYSWIFSLWKACTWLGIEEVDQGAEAERCQLNASTNSLKWQSKYEIEVPQHIPTVTE